MEVNKEKIQEALIKIVNTDAFIQSEVYVFILRFLVDSYLTKENVKETVIEAALSENLKTGQSFEGNVRVYMFNLRKKLNTYYNTIGAEDKLIFEIKKGQYNLSIKKNHISNTQTLSKLKKKKVFLFLAAIVFVIVLLGILIFPNKKEKYCWNGFFEKDANTICFVGDHFATRGIIGGQSGSVYFDGVNSQEEFNIFANLGKIDTTNFKTREYSFVSKMGPICTAKLATWFSEHNSIMDVRMESDFIADNITDHNIIYIGPYKTFTHLNSIFLGNSKQFTLRNKELFDTKKDTVLSFKKKEIWKEYVMVSFHELTDGGRKILFFAGDQDIGVMATVANFTDAEWLEKFYLKLPKPSAYYNALFVVKGIGRTNIESELIQVEVLD
ncbi:hypothetical protein ACFLRU_07070 [Bacteroidota bacterium]